MLRKIVIEFRILLILGLRVIMFGFNIFELMVVLVVAIIFLGPDKLPKLIVDVVKFFKMIKKSINEAKETLDKELQISELKKEALEYKSQFEQSTQNFTKEIQLQDVDEMFKDYKDSDETSGPAPESKANPKSPKKVKETKAGESLDFPYADFGDDFGGFAAASAPIAPHDCASSPTKEALESSALNPQKPSVDSPSSLAPSHQAKPKVGKTTSFKKKES